MDVRIVEINIKQKKYLLVSPCKKKLASMKKVIEISEHEDSDEKLSWEEFEMLQDIRGKGLSDGLDYIIKTSFITLNIDETIVI
jgi:hypothetical protein